MPNLLHYDFVQNAPEWSPKVSNGCKTCSFNHLSTLKSGFLFTFYISIVLITIDYHYQDCNRKVTHKTADYCFLPNDANTSHYLIAFTYLVHSGY